MEYNLIFTWFALIIAGSATIWLSILAAKQARLIRYLEKQNVRKTRTEQDRLMDFYFGPRGAPKRDVEERLLNQYPGRTMMGGILYRIHTHADACNGDALVYKEKDVIKLVELLGFDVKFGNEE